MYNQGVSAHRGLVASQILSILMANPLLKLILLATFLFGLPEFAEAKVPFPPKPSGDSFISDEASLL